MKIDLSDRKNMFYWQTNRPLTAQETKRVFMDRHDNIDVLILKKMVDSGMKGAGFSGADTKFEESAPIIRSGSVNSVIPILLRSGRKIVLRIHPKNVKNGYFWVEKVATSLALKKSIPTYETLFVDDSQENVPFDFMILSAVNGQPMKNFNPFTPDLEKKLVMETGKYAALIHSITPNGFGFFSNQIAQKEHKLVGYCTSFKEHLFAAMEEDLRFLIDNSVLNSIQHKNIGTLFNKSEHLMACQQGVNS